MPVDPRVANQHRILELGRADEPGSAGVVEQRRLATPAVRVRVLMQRRFPEHTAPLQLFENDGVRVLDEHPAHQRHVLRKLAAEIHWLKERQPVALARRIVVGTECRRHVHDPCSLVGRDERLADDYFVLAILVPDPIERSLVTLADQIAATK